MSSSEKPFDQEKPDFIQVTFSDTIVKTKLPLVAVGKEDSCNWDRSSDFDANPDSMTERKR